MLTVLVVVLAVVAVGALVGLVVARRRLADARRSASTAAAEAVTRADEVTRRHAELQVARDAADERVRAMEQQIADAQARLLDVERRAADAARRAGVDPDVAWELERARSERTWRFSVSPGPHVESTLAAAAEPLVEALQIELDAAREDVGAVVDLDASIPADLSPAASVLTLRLAQELLADVVRRSESTVLHVHDDDADLVIRVESVDADGKPVLPRPLPLDTAAIELAPDGVRLLGVLYRDPSEPSADRSNPSKQQGEPSIDAVGDEHHRDGGDNGSAPSDQHAENFADDSGDVDDHSTESDG
ncbi:hypothetical protein BH24ACT5_BH24ACT5_11480 [soil metagenome]